MISPRKMLEENNARHASQLWDPEKPPGNIPNKPNATELGLSTGRKPSTSLTYRTVLESGVGIDSQGTTSNANQSSSDLPEPKIPSNVPPATADEPGIPPFNLWKQAYEQLKARDPPLIVGFEGLLRKSYGSHDLAPINEDFIAKVIASGAESCVTLQPGTN